MSDCETTDREETQTNLEWIIVYIASPKSFWDAPIWAKTAVSMTIHTVHSGPAFTASLLQMIGGGHENVLAIWQHVICRFLKDKRQWTFFGRCKIRAELTGQGLKVHPTECPLQWHLDWADCRWCCTSGLTGLWSSVCASPFLQLSVMRMSLGT